MMRLKPSRVEAARRDAEVKSVQAVANRQRSEAVSLLGMAKVTGDALRKSRTRNHYGMILDDIFNGRRRA